MLFLDEVNELPGKLQRLLAILLGERKHNLGQDWLGGPVCVVSSSTCNLRREMKAGHFRRDLLQQLAIGVLDVPPIRDRVQDLPDICEYMRRRCCVQASVADRPFPHDLMERMLLYPWPGNLNELETFIRRFVALGPEYCGSILSRETDAAAFNRKWMM
jgi:DNA-binding NtrC family response regulator